MTVRVSTIVNPRTVLFTMASLNLIWFLSQSRMIQGFGSSTKITFCVVCPWYWDLTITSPPIPCWIACIFLLFRGPASILAAALVSVYTVPDGWAWVSHGNGFPASLFERIEILKTVGSVAWWE